MSEPIELTTKTIFSLVGIGIFSAIVHALNSIKNREHPNLLDFIINTLTAGLSALLTGLLASYAFDDFRIVSFLTGVGGYGGLVILNVLLLITKEGIRKIIIK